MVRKELFMFQLVKHCVTVYWSFYGYFDFLPWQVSLQSLIRLDEIRLDYLQKKLTEKSLIKALISQTQTRKRSSSL